VRIRGNKGEGEAIALFDTGASRTFIRKDVAQRVGDAVKLPKPREIVLGDGETKTEVNENINLVIMVDEYQISSDADVIDKLAHELIIGANTLQEWGISLDPRQEKIIIKEPKTSFELV
jgi:predicted aspartyl protease